MNQKPYFLNPVVAQQRLADDQLPMQQEALRLQELAQLLQASQQNNRTQSEERQNKERVGAQRYQTEAYGDVARGQNDIGRRKAENDILQGINELALRREQLNQQAEQFRGQMGLSREQLTNALEIAKVNANRDPMRSQDRTDILMRNADIEGENAAAQALLPQIMGRAQQLQKDEFNTLDGKYWGLGSESDARKTTEENARSGGYILKAIAEISSNPASAFIAPSGTNAVVSNTRRPIGMGTNPALTAPLQSTNVPAHSQEEALANILRLLQGASVNNPGAQPNGVQSGRFRINAVK